MLMRQQVSEPVPESPASLQSPGIVS